MLWVWVRFDALEGILICYQDIMADGIWLNANCKHLFIFCGVEKSRFLVKKYLNMF